MEGGAAGQHESAAAESAARSRSDASSELAPLVKASARTVLERATLVTWALNCAGVALGGAVCYALRDYPRTSDASAIFNFLYFVVLGLSAAVAAVPLLSLGQVSPQVGEWANLLYFAFGGVFVLLLLSGHPSVLNAALVDIAALAMVAACALGVLAAVTKNHTVLYGYIVFWGANLVLLLLAVYYLLPFAHNTSPARWQTRVADLWERTVLNAPEVICSIQAEHSCSGLTFPCAFWPRRLARQLPKRFQRPRCAGCGTAAGRSCQRFLQARLLENEMMLLCLAVGAGIVMLSLIGSAAITLYQILWADAEGIRAERAVRERDMKQAEPIVQAILQCRTMMMQLVKEMDGGRVPHQEIFTQLMLRLDAIDLSPVDEGPMKDRLRAAKRQHIEQLEILSQRALAMRPSGQPLAPAALDAPTPKSAPLDTAVTASAATEVQLPAASQEATDNPPAPAPAMADEPTTTAAAPSPPPDAPVPAEE
eukprot:EG_transcript_9080